MCVRGGIVGRAAAVPFAALLATLAVLPAGAADIGVKIRDDYFSRSYRVILVGDSVTWTNDGQREHTVASYPGAPKGFSSHESSSCSEGGLLTPDPDDCINQGGTYSVEFDEPGIYHYFCRVHGDPSVDPDRKAGDGSQPCRMCGTIEVREDSNEPPPTRPPSPTKSVSPSRSRSPSPSATASLSPSPTRSADPLASGSDSGGAGGRVAFATLAILGLGGAGYLTWRKFLAG